MLDWVKSKVGTPRQGGPEKQLTKVSRHFRYIYLSLLPITNLKKKGLKKGLKEGGPTAETVIYLKSTQTGGLRK